MATIRRAGFGTVFELEDSKVGIGTDAATHTLQALGNIRSEDATDIGISSLSTYQGFTDKEARFTGGQIDIESQSGATSGEIVIDGEVTVSSATTFTSGPQHLTVTDTFTLPSGDTNSRELKPTVGSFRFNQDFATLEFYTGNNWATVNTLTEVQNSPSNRGRGVIGGGRSPNHTTSMEFIQFHTLGNGISFGDLQNNSTYKFPNSSAVRGIFAGGYEPGGTHDTNIINYITIASEGDAIDFGDLVTDSGIGSGASSSTRGIQFGGWVHPGTNHNVIQYIEISTLGNSLDFGDTNTTLRGWGATNSTTRGIIAGGEGSVPANSLMEFITIAALGNGVEFGDLTQARRLDNQNASGSTRGVFMGGGWADSTDTIDFVNHASLGNAVDFGNLINETGLPASCASLLRGIVCGGYDPAHVNIIEFVTIATAGNAQDFGDMSETRHGHTAISDCNGGLGGF